MASLRVLAFDHEGRPIQFDTWLDDLQLYLLSDSKDSVSLFDVASGAATAPPATADSATRSQWLTYDAAAHLAIRNHLALAECAHFGQHRIAHALYDAVVARYSSLPAALGRLLLPYLFPELSAFATVEDLVSHLRASDARYRAAAPAEFLDKNQPPMFITLYFIVTRLPDSLRSVRDHFLSLDPTSLTVDLLEQHLLAAETSAFAVVAARGTPRPPFFEGCSPSPLAPSYAFAAAADVSVAEDAGAASASAKRRNSKGKSGEGSGGGSGGGGGGSGSSGGGSSGGGGGGRTGGGSGGSGGGARGSRGSGGSGGSGTGGSGTGIWRVGFGGGQRHQQQRRNMGVRAGQTCRKLHTQHRCFSRLDNAWRAEFGDDVELPRWADLLKSRIAIFDLDFDAILSAMYALSVSAEGDCYRCVPPNLGIAAAALGASESGTLPGTAPTEALQTFTLDSSASACFFRDSTTLTPLSTTVSARLVDPSGGPVVARSSTFLLCPAVPSGSLSGLHLPSFSTNLVSTAALQDAMVTTTTPRGSSLYTLATESPEVAASAQVAASCSCRLLSHLTLLWHHRLGHPSLPRLRGMHSRLLVSGLPRSLHPLPPSPAPPCLPCVEGRQRTAPHSSSFPPTTAPLQTLPMDVWGPARVSGQSRECYFLLVVDDYMRYTTVFPLRSKGQVVDVLIPSIRTVRLHLREHSPQQKEIAERRIGLVMEVARTSMIHVAAPHFLWPFAVRYAAHQINLWPCVSLPETSPTLRWTGEVCDASLFRVLGSRAFVHDTSADKLFPRAIPCVFLGVVPDAPGWQFYHPTSHHVFPSQDVTFDESIPFYRLFPYRSAPLPPPPIFLARGPPPLSAQVLLEVLRLGVLCLGVWSVGVRSLRVLRMGVAEPEGAETGGAAPGGVDTGGGDPGGTEPEGVEPDLLSAMAAHELCWLTYLLTNLGEQPRLPPERGQLRLAYVATRASTADIFTKALPPGHHQRFSTVLGLLALLFLTGLVTTCSPPLCLWGLSCGTTDLVTPPCHAFVACTPVFLSLVFPGLCLPSRPRLPRPAFLASRDGSAPLLTPPCFPRRLLPCRLSKWTKGGVLDVLISWIRAVRLQLRERFRQDLPVLRLHSDRGGVFSSNLLREFCRGEGILQSFTLPASPQQNGIAERRIGLVMEVACTSMIHAAVPHFLWPFVVRYAAHQFNLGPQVSLPETSPTLRWTGKVGDASVFRVWGSCAFVPDTSADKLSACAIPCVFLGFPLDAPGWQVYHPTSRCLLPSQDVTFDESVPFHHLFLYCSVPSLPPPLFLAPGPPPVDPLLPQGPAPSDVSQVDPLLGTVLSHHIHSMHIL
ncbi:unnamed protein product [Closterium sp. NIES-53]